LGLLECGLYITKTTRLLSAGLAGWTGALRSKSSVCLLLRLEIQVSGTWGSRSFVEAFDGYAVVRRWPRLASAVTRLDGTHVLLGLVSGCGLLGRTAGVVGYVAASAHGQDAGGYYCLR
jgi:hypothetical protein